MASDDEIEAAAKRAYEKFAEDDPDSWKSWERVGSISRARWLAVVRAAQLPPKLCGSCRHWGDPRDHTTRGDDHCECQAINGYDRDGKAYVSGGGDRSGIWTRAEWGCVDYQPTEAKPPA